jgi:hypothetical protein
MKYHGNLSSDSRADTCGRRYALFATAPKKVKGKGKKKNSCTYIMEKVGKNNSYVVVSLKTQKFPMWANSPHFWNRDVPYRIHQSSQHTPGLNETNPIRAFTSAPRFS